MSVTREQNPEAQEAERSTRGYHPAEREAKARARSKYERTRSKLGADAPTWDALTGNDRQARIASELRTDQPRYLLALKVRAASTASDSEAKFVRRMRRSGLLVRPRYADGRTDVITGYSVAERPIWYGGGRMERRQAVPARGRTWTQSERTRPGAVGQAQRRAEPARGPAALDPRRRSGHLGDRRTPDGRSPGHVVQRDRGDTGRPRRGGCTVALGTDVPADLDPEAQAMLDRL